MEIQPVLPGDRPFINSYGADGFTISGVKYDGGVILYPDRTEPWAISDIGDLGPDDLAAIAQAEAGIEVLLIGCGTNMVLLPRAVRERFAEQPFSVDVMATGAACRTYNVLVSESRRVAAAMVPVG